MFVLVAVAVATVSAGATDLESTVCVLKYFCPKLQKREIVIFT